MKMLTEFLVYLYWRYRRARLTRKMKRLEDDWKKEKEWVVSPELVIHVINAMENDLFVLVNKSNYRTKEFVTTFPTLDAMILWMEMLNRTMLVYTSLGDRSNRPDEAYIDHKYLKNHDRYAMTTMHDVLQIGGIPITIENAFDRIVAVLKETDRIFKIIEGFEDSKFMLKMYKSRSDQVVRDMWSVVINAMSMVYENE